MDILSCLCLQADRASYSRLRIFGFARQRDNVLDFLQFFVQFRFHNVLASLAFIQFFAGTWQCSVSLRQAQASKQDNHAVQRKFASNRHFVRGSVGTPEGNSSISGNHGIQCRAPSLGSRILKASSISETNGFIDSRL